MQHIKFSDIKINDGFWKIKQDMVRESTVLAVYDRFRDTHRFDALSCTWKPGDPNRPNIFWDSDVAKWMEGVSYLLLEKRDEKLEAIIDAAVQNIVENSDADGYFNSHFLVTDQEKRFKNRDCHELYCAGHLMEAACAYYEATGKDAFLKAMCRFADDIERVFKKEKSAAFTTPGHPEIELALVRLYETTGEKRYLALAKFFIDEHGCGKDHAATTFLLWNELYNQDDMPLRERTTAEGHCVRALYLFCGMADIAEKYNDAALLRACQRVFDDMVNKKMYITGGVGATYIGEAFSVPYYLPNRTAYSETCAAIAMALFCRRMQTLDLHAKYADVAERVIYNGFLSGISMNGKEFFYENPLEIDIDFNAPNPSSHEKERFPITQRKAVFDCSCCPPNVVRFIPSIADLMYHYDNETLYVNQYMSSSAACGDIKITQKTAYPADGVITITCSAPQKYLALRIPAWCRNFRLNADYTMKNGYAYVRLLGETEIELCLDMPVVCVKANRRVHENAGRIAVTRGPLVYCAESVDNGKDLKSIKIDTNAPFALCDNEFILPSITAHAYREKESDRVYAPLDESEEEAMTLRLIPYYAFANRGAAEMLVWFLKK